LPVKSNPEWTKYSVGKPSTTKNWVEPDCLPLDIISHACHIHHALDAVREGSILPRLVYDQSKLNTERVTVVWLSPNSWYQGSRYGNVEFDFHLADLLLNRKPYWVETAQYSIRAPRILLTKSVNVPSALQPYDPTRGDGPWWHDTTNNTHWWNGQITLEFMIDEPMPLSQCAGISFISHHDDYCCLNRYNPKSCRDLGRLKESGRNRFISSIVLRNLRSVDNLFAKNGTASADLKAFGADLYAGILYRHKTECTGSVTSQVELAPVLARAYLDARLHERLNEAKLIAKQFTEPVELAKSCGHLVNAHFGLESPGVLEDYI